jgi:hypothetical protein
MLYSIKYTQEKESQRRKHTTIVHPSHPRHQNLEQNAQVGIIKHKDIRRMNFYPIDSYYNFSGAKYTIIADFKPLIGLSLDAYLIFL